MPAQLDEKITSWFMADTTNFERGIDRAGKALDGLSAKERKAAAETKKLADKAKKAFDARAATTKNIVLDPGGAAQVGLDKLVSSMKFSAVTTGALSAGISIAASKFSEYREEAMKARAETEAFNEEFRKGFESNVHTSAASGSSDLISRLQASREQERALKQKSFDLNPPEGSVAEFQMRARYVAADPLNAEDNLQRDQGQVKLQLQGNQQQQVKLQKDIEESMKTSLALTKEQLQGSTHQVRIKELELARQREIQDLQDTTANNPGNVKVIEEKYQLQISAEKELQKNQERRFNLASKIAGIEISSRTDAQKRVDVAKRNLEATQDQLRTSQFANQEERQSLLLQSLNQGNALKQAQAELGVETTRTNLAKQITATQSSNAASTAKGYQATLDTNAALTAQLALLKDIDGTKAAGLQNDIANNENTIREARQTAMYGKTGGQVEEEMRRNRENKTSRDKFDKTMGKTDGLVEVSRDLAGNIVSGIDPITGNQRPPRPGTGGAEQGLHSGINSATGEPGLFTRHLATPGTTPSMFGGADLFAERHTADVRAGKLDRRGVAEKLADPTGSGFGDPVATMNKAPMFPDLKKSIAKEFGGAGLGMGGAIDAARAVSSSRSPGEALIKLGAKSLQTQSGANELLGGVLRQVTSCAVSLQDLHYQ